MRKQSVNCRTWPACRLSAAAARRLRFGSLDYQTSVTGVWPSYVDTQSWQMARGSFVTEEDVKSYAAVIVLGKTVADNLFPGGEDPIGKFVLVGNVPFEVIGVLAPKGANAFGSDMDDAALVPLSTGSMRVFGVRYLNSINVKIKSTADSDATQSAITSLLLARHGLQDFQVRSTSSLLETAESTQNTLTLLLGSVAAISLLVGGIGVMNIMLVNVTERTREIGVRMATGARTSSILLQFNTEALVVCGIGGLDRRRAGIRRRTSWRRRSAAMSRSRRCRRSSRSLRRLPPACCSAICRRARPRIWIRSLLLHPNEESS